MATSTILPEILLIIMEHMDMKQLLDACFVNRTWYDAATFSARNQLSRFLLSIPQLRYHQVLLDFRQVLSQNQLIYRVPILPEEHGLVFLRFFLRSSLGSYATLHWAGTTLDADQGIKFKLKAEREDQRRLRMGLCQSVLTLVCRVSANWRSI